MPSNDATLLLLGCGPGVGLSSAKALAATGHFRHMVLCSRNEERLKQHAQDVISSLNNSKAVKIHTMPTNLNDLNSLRDTIKRTGDLGLLQCVLFNAARIKPSKPLEADVEELREDLETSTLALYVTAQETIRMLNQKSDDRSRPAFIVTNSHLPESPVPEVLILSVAKAAQQNMVQSLDATFGDMINYAVIKIKGTVGTEEGHIRAEAVAERIVDVHQKALNGEKNKLLIDIDP